jgi:hypothetical protein
VNVKDGKIILEDGNYKIRISIGTYGALKLADNDFETIYLTQQQVKDLLPNLTEFANTGKLEIKE